MLHRVKESVVRSKIYFLRKSAVDLWCNLWFRLRERSNKREDRAKGAFNSKPQIYLHQIQQCELSFAASSWSPFHHQKDSGNRRKMTKNSLGLGTRKDLGKNKKSSDLRNNVKNGVSILCWFCFFNLIPWVQFFFTFAHSKTRYSA